MSDWADQLPKIIMTQGKVMREAIVKIFSKCPASCAFCDYGNAKETYGSSVGEPSLSQLERFFKEFGAAGGEVVILSGGETTLRKDFEKVASSAKNNKLFVVLNTAGIGIRHPRMRSKILGSRDIDMVVVSLDSLNVDIHNEFRGIPNLFEDVEDFFSERWIEAKRKQYAIRFVVTKQNFRDLPNLVSFADLHKLDAVKVTILEGQEASHLLLDQQDLDELYSVVKPSLVKAVNSSERMSQLQKERANSAINVFLAPINRTVGDIAVGRYRPNLGQGCDLPERFTMIKENGDYLECCQAEYFGDNSLGNVFEMGLEEIRDSNTLTGVKRSYCQFCGEFDAFQLSFGGEAEVVEQR